MARADRWRELWLSRAVKPSLVVVLGFGALMQGLLFLGLVVIGVLIGVPWVPASALTYGLLLHMEHFFTWLLCAIVALNANRDLFYATLIVYIFQTLADTIVGTLVLVGLITDFARVLTDATSATTFGIILSLAMAVLSWVVMSALWRLRTEATRMDNLYEASSSASGPTSKRAPAAAAAASTGAWRTSGRARE